MANLTVVGCGALNWDCLFKVQQLVTDSESIVEESFEAPGGSAANTIYALAKWGTPTGFLGAVGDDSEGQHIIADLQGVGVDTQHIRVVKGQRTGRVLGLIDSKGRRSLYVQPGANKALRLTEADLHFAARAECVHLSSLVGDAMLEQQQWLVQQLPKDVLVSFAPGTLYAQRGAAALESLLRRATVLFLTRHELASLTGTENLEAAAQQLWSLGVEVLVVTLGEQGSWVGSNGKGRFAPSVQAHVVDTTGAGDAFAAGFLWGFLNGRPLPECQRLGTIAAAFCLRALGARTGTPTLDELLAVAFG
ncbi:Ribokinase [bacterium HR17]|uniref:Ribokinase n=1 Tax=Candidatus Fervidibacter japonicus TaxID=2035412 RepID=A0A2H5X8Q0_9BACT|nr:Ribokinase [bacterium HR17]